MGLRGPAPKPTAVRLREGNPGRKPINQYEPNYSSALPQKPKPMSKGAKKVWDELVIEMSSTGVLRHVDARALWQLAEDEAILSEVYAGLWQMAAALKKQARAEKRTLPAGEIMSLLSMKTGRLAMASLRDLSARTIIERREFGLTPSSRSRINASGDITSIDALELKLCG